MESLIPIICLLTAISGFGRAQDITGTSLDITIDGYDPQIGSTDAAGAIGYYNYVTGTGTMALGLYNTLDSIGSLAVGYANYVGSPLMDRSLAVGASNMVQAANSAAFGDTNQTFGWEGLVSNCVQIGSYNYSRGFCYDSLTVGTNNIAVSVTATTTLGKGLISSNWVNATVVGQYNVWDGAARPLFVIGNGTSSTARSNAMEVYGDGAIKILKRQGDVGMGRFGNTADQ